jgi:hypothetical protein
MWFVFGDSVFDRILNTDRSRSIDVYFEDATEKPDSVAVRRLMIKPSDRPLVYFTNELPEIVADCERYVITSEGTYFDRLTKQSFQRVNSPLELRLLRAEPTFDQLLHLWFTHKIYPEIVASLIWLRKLEEDVAHLEDIAAVSPDIAQVFLSEQFRLRSELDMPEDLEVHQS